jgi:hypothetical protein
LARTSPRRGSTFGRGRAASLAASRLLGSRARGAIVKARVVRRLRSPGALRAHVGYLQRDGVTRDGERGRLFDAAGDEADGRAFAESCKDDRHHFRFIVSPDDAAELQDLRSYNRFPCKEDMFFDLDDEGRELLRETLLKHDRAIGPVETLRLD